MDRFDAQVLACCQIGNHCHLVLHTHQANLSRLMRHVNGVYTQALNQRHALVGHLFQGRFKAILVDSDAYLLALCRYVDRNPVAADLVGAAEEWPWSSCRAHVCMVATPPWLDSHGLHGYLLGRPVTGERDRKRAAQRYAGLTRAALGGRCPKTQRKSPCILKDCLKRFPDRADALRMAYRECGITMTDLARELGLSVSRVSRLIAASERVAGDGGPT